MNSTVTLATNPEALAAEGLTDAVAPWEDGQRLDIGPGSFEWWYFDAHLEDGSTAVVVFSTKPLLERKGPLKPNVQLMITRPDGTKSDSLPIYKPNTYRAAKDHCDVHIGPNWIKGDLSTYQVHVEIGDQAADLTFSRIVPSWRPGTGKMYFGKPQDFFAWLPSIPYGTVEGTLKYDGQVHHVTGTGYHDHNWGSVGIEEVLDHWYWGRAHIGDYSLIFVEMMSAKKYGNAKLPVFLLARGDQVLIGDGTPLTMITRDFVRHPGGRAYPREVDFHWQSEDGSVDLCLRKPALIEGMSLLYYFPPWQQKLLRMFTNPFYFRFIADLELTINLKDLKTKEQGHALYEIMILQGKRHP